MNALAPGIRHLRLVSSRGDTPLKRGDCADVPRPCRYTDCRHHLASDPESMCSLDLADRGGMGVDETAKAMGVTRQRIDQIERVAVRKLNRKLREWRDY
jgi:hypothetical protein